MARFLETFAATVLTAFFLFASCTSCTHYYRRTIYLNNPTFNTKKFHESVLLVRTQPGEKGYESWSATAWAFDEDHLMTAGHFCETVEDYSTLKKASKKIKVIGSDRKGMTYEEGEATVLAWINAGPEDICILKMEGHEIPPLPITSMIDIVETEDPVTMVGAPDGKYPLRRDGYIWAVAPKYIALAMEAQGGNSGSPVIWNNEVVGMLIQTVNGLSEGTIAVRADKLLIFIEEHIDSKKE